MLSFLVDLVEANGTNGTSLAVKYGETAAPPSAKIYETDHHEKLHDIFSLLPSITLSSTCGW